MSIQGVNISKNIEFLLRSYYHILQGISLTFGTACIFLSMSLPSLRQFVSMESNLKPKWPDDAYQMYIAGIKTFFFETRAGTKYIILAILYSANLHKVISVILTLVG